MHRPGPYITADPARHVVVPSFPCDPSAFVSDLAQPFRKFVGSRGQRQRENSLQICDAVERVQRSHKDFGCFGRSDQGIYSVGLPNKLTGENFNSAAGGIARLRFGQKPLNAPPAKISWSRV